MFAMLTLAADSPRSGKAGATDLKSATLWGIIKAKSQGVFDNSLLLNF